MTLSPTQPKVYIILVNYNRWQDTIECLESVLKLSYPEFSVVVVDNNSQNDSWIKIQEWAKGHRAAPLNSDFYTQTGIDNRAVPKPVSYQAIDKPFLNPAEINGTGEKLTLIKSHHNLGFAGGNNLATAFALGNGDAEYFWYLNNDTVVEKDALIKIIDFALEEEGSGIRNGIIGTKLLFYHQPNVLQGIGGKYNKWLGLTSHVWENQCNSQLEEMSLEVARIDYPIGASMVVKKDFIGQVGLMSEDYFLYFEELDWAERAKKYNWNITSFLNCQVYHKESASIGSNKDVKSKIADFYNLRNRILITKKFFLRLLTFCVSRLFSCNPQPA